MQTGRSWELLEGFETGQTHVDAAGEGEMAVWAHPLDVHFVCRGLTGWPKLYFQVWTQDAHGRNDVVGYGFCHVPTAPGMYELDCPTWLPEARRRRRPRTRFPPLTPPLPPPARRLLPARCGGADGRPPAARPPALASRRAPPASGWPRSSSAARRA